MDEQDLQNLPNETVITATWVDRIGGRTFLRRVNMDSPIFPGVPAHRWDWWELMGADLCMDTSEVVSDLRNHQVIWIGE